MTRMGGRMHRAAFGPRNTRNTRNGTPTTETRRARRMHETAFAPEHRTPTTGAPSLARESRESPRILSRLGPNTDNRTPLFRLPPRPHPAPRLRNSVHHGDTETTETRRPRRASTDSTDSTDHTDWGEECIEPPSTRGIRETRETERPPRRHGGHGEWTHSPTCPDTDHRTPNTILRPVASARSAPSKPNSPPTAEGNRRGRRESRESCLSEHEHLQPAKHTCRCQVI